MEEFHIEYTLEPAYFNLLRFVFF